ncbi:hypothetical protein LARI1_G007985 [Lachnellula arida]|uniref:Stress-response A/B barrel domain-containing protein n=1 Tax=Lachnellula arida TaxID=1316785 RepID=A0A8T9BAZ8_9HELO|nr:hypothetical protein LARI1_G007985 [Lachnellula arida]
MTVIHIVLVKFLPTVSATHKKIFVHELKQLKLLPSVLNGRLIVGGPSVSDPIETSKGFQYALLSYHKNREAMEEYQASEEHLRVIKTYVFPYKEDLMRFDFEVDAEDEYMCRLIGDGLMKGFVNQAQEE